MASERRQRGSDAFQRPDAAVSWFAAFRHCWRRSWFGHHFPGASVGGLANPDNVYRKAFIDGPRRHEIRGRRHRRGPQTFSIELARQEPGVFVLAPAGGRLEADLGDQLGILTERTIEVAADGSFPRHARAG